MANGLDKSLRITEHASRVLEQMNREYRRLFFLVELGSIIALDLCPGDIERCDHGTIPHYCMTSGGTTVSVMFPVKSER
ncbi:MAG: hypothetical protein PHC68_17545 [Syntrophorhabdaceae bacterium]|nr:hypothetical protein [Syntrophorhabdaceae bacterium]